MSTGDLRHETIGHLIRYASHEQSTCPDPTVRRSLHRMREAASCLRTNHAVITGNTTHCASGDGPTPVPGTTGISGEYPQPPSHNPRSASHSMRAVIVTPTATKVVRCAAVGAVIQCRLRAITATRSFDLREHAGIAWARRVIRSSAVSRSP